ncbi:PAS domain S-box protein [Chitinophaga horti]|uniref:PAS domain S-box protein n=1 Tax=Chitinophaga horti TaxID=2920382 RepID=A0ABY6J4D1_9BACT|nr:PAS domain S-box protein [Chitinophaga horti]UYQ93149.1 PAS domain S-box protein [Chitinophaga horti]
MRHTAVKAACLFLLWGLVWVNINDRLLAYGVLKFPQFSPAALSFLLLSFFILTAALLIYFVVRSSQQAVEGPSGYQEMFYNHPVPMWVYDTDTLRFLAVNDAAIEKYGFTRNEFLKMTILQIRDENDISKLLEDQQRSINSKSYRGVWQHRKKNGENFMVEIYSTPSQYKQKRGRMVMAIDIDAEIKSTIQAKDFGTRYELLAKVTPDAIYYWDMSSDQVTWNHGPSTIFGYQESEVEPTFQWWEQRVHPDDHDRIIRSVRNAIRFGNVHWADKYRFLCTNGQYKHVYARGSIIYSKQQEAQRMVGVVQDIDKEVKQQEQIGLLSLVASQTTNSVFIMDAEGRVQWANDSFTHHTGFSLKEAIGKHPREFMAGPETSIEAMNRIGKQMETGVPFTAELVQYRKNGEAYWVHMSVTPILDDENSVQKYISIQTDITEKKNFVTLLQEQNNTLREIAWMNSHELRKPVSSILAITSLIDTDSTDQPTNLRLMLMLQKSVTELDEMIHRMQEKLKQQEDDLR